MVRVDNNYSLRTKDSDANGNIRWLSWNSGLTETLALAQADDLRKRGTAVRIYRGTERTEL